MGREVEEGGVLLCTRSLMRRADSTRNAVAPRRPVHRVSD